MESISITNGQSSSPYLDRSAFPLHQVFDCLCQSSTGDRAEREDRMGRRLTKQGERGLDGWNGRADGGTSSWT